VVKLSRVVDEDTVVGVDLAHDLFELSLSQLTRFQRLGDLADIEDCIANVQKAVQSTDDNHDDANKAEYLDNLGFSQRLRFDRLGELTDINRSISNLNRAVRITDDGDPNKPTYLSNLGISQLRRYDRLDGLNDIADSISHQQRALQLTDDLDPNNSTYLSNLGLSQQIHFEHLGGLDDINESISNLNNAIQYADYRDPNKPVYHSVLGVSQLMRYNRLGGLNDIDESISNLQKALQLTEDKNPSKPTRLSHLGLSQQVRFNRLGELTDIEQSILNHQKAVQYTVGGQSQKAVCLSNFALSQRARFQHLGELTDIEDCISNLHRAVQSIDDGHPEKAKFLSNLGLSQRDRFERLSELTDIEDCILNLRGAVQLTDDGHPNKAKYLSHLGLSHLRRYERLGGMEDIEDSISNQQRAIQLTEDGDPSKPIRLSHLGLSQRARFDLLGKPADLMASISAFKTAAQSKTAYPRDALQAARNWADLSHHYDNMSSALDGYRTALEILPKVAWLGLSTSSLRTSLSQVDAEHLSCLAAACAIQQGRLEEAVELLDVGRSVFWQQASSLRVELEKLKEMEPELADQLERVGQKLDAGNFSGSLLPIDNQNIGVNSIKDVVMERRRQVDEWDSLLDKVRQLSHFENFLRPVPFHLLRQAAVGGQIIIININRYRVDALIFDAAHQIVHVPLLNANLETLSLLTGDILLHQPIFSSPTQRQSYTTRFLKPALRYVWDDIVVPIFDTLRFSINGNSDQPQHRIWWYPTGPLTFIPIHAAGPGRGIDVSRLVCSSYVTTLSSHFHAKKKMELGVKGQLKLLAVSQPETPGQESLPLSMDEVDTVVQAVSSAGWPAEDIVHLNGSEATVEQVSCALNSSSWIHFACHGMQHPKSGMDSAFALHNGYLELSQIASKRLSTGQFAFLSACNTAAGIEQLPGEAIHLAGALQFAGFPNVIATMWSVSDKDASIVARHVYEYLFRNRFEGCNPSEAATALSHAVLLLREHESMTVDRWAPFIHFGI
jgi:tetratricopeptide (TPR) repeat protein